MPGPKDNRPLTYSRLTEVLGYDPADGVFTWKVKQARNTHVGGPAGGKRNGKFYVRIDKADYTAARLAWFYMTGQWPHRLKFKDGDVLNARFSNLEETHALPEKFDNTTPDGRIAYLKAHRERYGEVWRESSLKSKFGITMAEYQAMHDAQNGCCAICNQPETVTRSGKLVALSVDHNHETGAVRQLLCRGCNQLIGNAREDAVILRAAIAYLEQHSKTEGSAEPIYSFEQIAGMGPLIN